MIRSPRPSLAETTPASGSGRTAIWSFLAAGGTALALAVLVVRWLRLGPVDDAFISLRYAFHWAHGAGLVYNPGERVEGYTNFLLVFLEATAIRLGVDPVGAMLWIGKLALAATVGLTAAFASRVAFPRSRLLPLAAGWVLAVHPGMLAWGTSGLETALNALLLLAALWVALRVEGTRGALGSALLLVLAAMTRPETVVVLPALLYAAAGPGRSRRRVPLTAAVFLAGFGTYFVLRALHFGALFPNTFYAKLDYGGAMILRRGLLYVWDFIQGNPLLVLLAAALPATARLGAPVPRWAKAMALASVLWTLGVIYEGGDHFSLFRFLVPIVPLLVLTAFGTLKALVGAWNARRRRPGRGQAWSLALLALAASGLLVLPQHKRDETAQVTHFNRYLGECDLTRQWQVVGVWLRSFMPPEIPVCTIAIGAVGYRSGLTVLDPYGLVNPGIAHLHRKLGTGYAGHEKYDVDAILDRRPGVILIIHYPTRRPVPVEDLPRQVWGGFYHDLIRSPRLFGDYVYRTYPLGEWTMNVMVRRDLDRVLRPGRPAG